VHTVIAGVTWLACGGFAALAEDAVRPGELIIEPPTLICLGFEWRVEGDENGNATGSVHYRKCGDKLWRQSMPLLRTGRGRSAGYGFGSDGVPAGPYTIPDALAGSIIDLEPGTDYEVRLQVTDPDGVQGRDVRELRLSTRPDPVPFAGGEVRYVYPPGYKGDREQPAYRSIMHAVNGFHPWCDCYQTVHPNAAQPGTVVKVHAGTYKSDYTDYRHNLLLWLHGMRTLVADGEPGKPIAIVAAGDGEVIIDAAGADVGFNIMAADYLYFEGLTIRDARIAFHAGLQGVMGCKGLTVKNCWLDGIQYGVLAQDGRSEGFYIGDNVMMGRNPHDRFNPESGGAYGRTKGGYAVNLSGKGHVVCHNYTSDFWDVINVFTNALADPALGQQARAIDFYNNDLFNATDNFIESDGGYGNIRILRNRCFNCMGAPLSVQPVYAGPVYWIRNVVYNAHKGSQAFKMASGDNVICYHNTSTCHWTVGGGMDWGDVRNNLFMGPADFIGERDRQRGRKVLSIGFQRPDSLLDYNAHRIGLPGDDLFQVNTEGGGTYGSLAELAANTPYEYNSITVDGYALFVDAEEPDHVPSNQGRLYHAIDVDLRPRADAPVVDAGCAIPGVNDGFAGAAPDIGAYEAGRPAPVYGPRTGSYLERLKALREGRWLPSAVVSSEGQATGVPVGGASAGNAVDRVADRDGDGVIEAISACAADFSCASLVFGTPRSDVDIPLADMCNFDMTNGMPSSGSADLVVDVTDFGGGVWHDTNGEAPDFFIFEAGGNDRVYIAPILADDTVGRAAGVGEWGDTGIGTPIGAGNAVGVAIEVTELMDAAGRRLKRDVALKGLRLISKPSGMDLLCVCAVEGK
jgi:hypothetical protein